MQFVNATSLGKLKVALANSTLEKVLIIVKLVCIVVILALEVSSLDRTTLKYAERVLKQERLNWRLVGDNSYQGVTQLLKEYSRIAQNYSLIFKNIRMHQIAITVNASLCQNLDCLSALNEHEGLYRSSILYLDQSQCVLESCPEFFSSRKSEHLTTFKFFGLSSPSTFIVQLSAKHASTLEAAIDRVSNNGWISNLTTQLGVEAVFEPEWTNEVFVILRQHFMVGEKFFQTKEDQDLVFSITFSTTQLAFSCILLIVCIISIAKPIVEVPFAPTKSIYYVGIYLKLAWISYAVLKLITYATFQSYSSFTGEFSNQAVTIYYLEQISSYVLNILFFAFIFEILKLVKGSAYLQQGFSMLSVLYGTALSILSYFSIIFTMYIFISLAAYGYFYRKIESNLPVFIQSFFFTDIDVSNSHLFDKVVYSIIVLMRYILWIYLLSIFAFYMRLVSTHIFSTYEPKYYKEICDKFTLVNKNMDHLNNELTNKPAYMSMAKNRRILVWLNYGWMTSNGQPLGYSRNLLNLFDSVEKQGIKISFFTNFRQVMAFLSSIYNIIPKILMSTTKSLRIVVSMNPAEVENRTEYELGLFARIEELHIFIKEMGLETEICIFEEIEQQHSHKSKIIRLMRTTIPHIHVTSNYKLLHRFSEMHGIDDMMHEHDAAYGEDIENLLIGMDDVQ